MPAIVLLTGSDGEHRSIGPFASGDEAQAWGTANFQHSDLQDYGEGWIWLDLEPPDPPVSPATPQV